MTKFVAVLTFQVRRLARNSPAIFGLTLCVAAALYETARGGQFGGFVAAVLGVLFCGWTWGADCEGGWMDVTSLALIPRLSHLLAITLLYLCVSTVTFAILTTIWGGWLRFVVATLATLLLFILTASIALAFSTSHAGWYVIAFILFAVHFPTLRLWAIEEELPPLPMRILIGMFLPGIALRFHMLSAGSLLLTLCLAIGLAGMLMWQLCRRPRSYGQ